MPATRLSTTLYPDNDNTFQNDSPNYNHGASDNMPAGEEDFTSTTYRLAVKFDLTALPANTVVTLSNMILYCFGDASNGTGRAKLYRILSSWLESTITWNNQPSHDAGVITYSDIGNGYVGDVTWSSLATLINQYLQGTYANYGFKMRITETGSDNENDKHFKFRTKEWSTIGQRPRLYLEYYYPPTISTSPAELIQQTKATLRANLSSINGDYVTSRGFQYGLTETAEYTISESGTFDVGQFTLTPTQLRSGTKYYFRAFATNAAGTTYGSWQSFNTISGGAILFGMI